VALAKLYAIALNKRLSDWTKKYLCRAKAQAGFHKDYRCAENLFILWTLLEIPNPSVPNFVAILWDF
jgi:hypothetical protein